LAEFRRRGVGKALWVTTQEFIGVSLKGKVSPVPESPGPTWIKLQSLYTRNAIEAEVTSTGTFEFSEPLHGDYIVLVFSGNRLLHTEPISITKQVPMQYLEVTLSG